VELVVGVTKVVVEVVEKFFTIRTSLLRQDLSSLYLLVPVGLYQPRLTDLVEMETAPVSETSWPQVVEVVEVLVHSG
jgi:hypothetical protein